MSSYVLSIEPRGCHLLIAYASGGVTSKPILAFRVTNINAFAAGTYDAVMDGVPIIVRGARLMQGAITTAVQLPSGRVIGRDGTRYRSVAAFVRANKLRRAA
jgi:hypothetical protein